MLFSPCVVSVCVLACTKLKLNVLFIIDRIQHFAAQNPHIAFTHIHPGVVRTSGLRIDLDGLFTPLTWLINLILPWIAVSQVRFWVIDIFNST
jgi:hypothetical protein